MILRKNGSALGRVGSLMSFLSNTLEVGRKMSVDTLDGLEETESTKKVMLGNYFTDAAQPMGKHEGQAELSLGDFVVSDEEEGVGASVVSVEDGGLK